MYVVTHHVARAQFLRVVGVPGIGAYDRRRNPVAVRAQGEVQAVVLAQLQFCDQHVGDGAEVFLARGERADDRRSVARVVQPRQQLVRECERV
jgi:hypothetical protein